MNCDLILLLSAGEIQEFDTPRNLLGIEGSEFGKLVDDTGAESAKLLREMVSK